MKTREQIIAAMDAVTKELEGLADKIETAKTEDEAKPHRDLARTKQAEFSRLQEDLKSVDALAANKAALEIARAYHAPDTSTIQQPERDPDTTTTTANDDALALARTAAIQTVKNAQKDELARCKFFADYSEAGPRAVIARNNGGERGLEAIRPSAELRARMRGVYNCPVVVPPALAQMILGSPKEVARAWPTLAMLFTNTTGATTDSGSRNLYPTTQYVPELITEPEEEFAIANMCRRIPAAFGNATYPKLDQVTGGRFAGVELTRVTTDGTTKTITSGAFTTWNVTTCELSAYVRPSLTLVRRSQIDLIGTMTNLLRRAAITQMGKDVVHGSGASGEPTGILTASINSVDRTATGTVSWKDGLRLYRGVKQRFRRGASIFMTDAAEGVLALETDKNDNPILNGDQIILAGRGTTTRVPYIVEDYTVDSTVEATARSKTLDDPLVALGAAGDMWFGNPYFYGLAVEQDVLIDRNDSVLFLSNEAAIRLICFYGGKPLIDRAFVKLAATAVAS